MELYLPIAEVAVSLWSVIMLGMVAGLMSGLFGIGGGFFTVPILVFMGLPPDVALSNSANQTVASSLTSFLLHWRKKNVDLQVGGLFFCGSMLGAMMGSYLLSIVKNEGLVDLVIPVIYILFLGSVAVMIAIESGKAIYYKRKGVVIVKALVHSEEKSGLLSRLPMQIKFAHTTARCSIIVIIVIGIAVGLLVALTGTGGGFLLVPAMIYLLKMPTLLAIGTSSYQILLITSVVTVLHIINMGTVDLLLSVPLMCGAVLGAQFGVRISSRILAEELRIILAVLILIMVIRLAIGLCLEPACLYSIEVTG